MPSYKKIIIFAVGFFVGIFAFEFFREGSVLWLVVLGLGGCVSVICLCKWCGKLEIQKVGSRRMSLRFGVLGWAVLLIFSFGIVAALVRCILYELPYENDVRNIQGSGVVEFYACLSEEPDVRENKVMYTVSDVVLGSEISRDKIFQGKILVSAPKYPLFAYGDVVKVVGKVENPKSSYDFAYDKYLAMQKIYSIVNSAKVYSINEKCGSLFFKVLYELKGIFKTKIEKIFPEPYASFIEGLLLGVRSGIPKNISDDFKTVGLTHIIAISGYNITLVITAVTLMFGFLSRRKRVIVTVFFIVVFVLLVGAGSSVVRAGVMGCISLFAMYFGRKGNVSVSIIVSALLMCLFNPLILVYDAGFQLSFLATIGLVYVLPKIEKIGGFLGKFLSKIPKTFCMRENLMMTLSAQSLTLPVILKSFGRFSLVCPLANIVILPFIPIVMMLSFCALILSLLSEFTGKIVGFMNYVVLEIVFFFVRCFAFLERIL